MMTIKSERPYVPTETHRRVELFAIGKNIPNYEAYQEIIMGALDEKGKPRNILSLTETQRKAIEDISKQMDQTIEQTIQDLINFSMLLYATPVTFREMFVYASPLLMDKLVTCNPAIAKEILRSLKQQSEIAIK